MIAKLIGRSTASAARCKPADVVANYALRKKTNKGELILTSSRDVDSVTVRSIVGELPEPAMDHAGDMVYSR